jgi:hypothetical protein
MMVGVGEYAPSSQIAPSGGRTFCLPMEASRFASEGHEVTVVGEIQNEGSVGKMSSLCRVIPFSGKEEFAETTME